MLNNVTLCVLFCFVFLCRIHVWFMFMRSCSIAVHASSTTLLILTVMSSGEFCSFSCVSWNRPRCVKRSCLLSPTHSPRSCHSHTGTNINSVLNTRHIFTKWHDGVEFGPGPPPVASTSVSSSFSLSFHSFPLFLVFSPSLAVITLIHFLLLARLLHSLWLKRAFIYPGPLGHTHTHKHTHTHVQALVRARAAPPDHRPRQAPLAPITLITS